MDRIKVAVFISGRGSNLKALIDAQNPGLPPRPSQCRYEIVRVVSNRLGAPGLRYAEQANIPTLTVSMKDQKAFIETVEETLLSQNVQLIVLAGFMRILDMDFVRRWENRILNIHPSLLPSFPGLHAQEQALAAGVKYTGCTVHYVVPEVDAGPIIAQIPIRVIDDDTPASLSERMRAYEHGLYPMVVSQVAAKLLDT